MKRNILLLAAVIITVVFCATPNFHPENIFHLNYSWWLDMIFHSSYYLFIASALYPVFKREKFNWIYFVGVLLISYGLELDQLLVPGRGFSLLDLTSNSLGISLAAGVSFAVFHRKNSTT